MLKRDTKFGNLFNLCRFSSRSIVKTTFIVDVLYMDVNHGSNDAPWDTIMTNERELHQLLVEVAANNYQNFMAVFIVPVQVLQMYIHTLTFAGYQDIEILHWMKSANHRGMNSAPQERYISAVVHIIVAKSPNKPYANALGPAMFNRRGNELSSKYNFFLGPDEPYKIKNTEGQIMNVDQRPSWLATYLVKPYVKIQGTAVVFGAGVGGDIEGLLNLGLHVIAIEQEKNQYFRLVTKFNYEFVPKVETFKACTMDMLNDEVRHLFTSEHYEKVEQERRDQEAREDMDNLGYDAHDESYGITRVLQQPIGVCRLSSRSTVKTTKNTGFLRQTHGFLGRN